MTPNSDIEDTSKALHSDGSWHLMPKDTWEIYSTPYDYPHQSVIYHQCRNYWKRKEFGQVWVPAVQYRIDVAELTIPCGHCDEVCPEGLQALWMLHNYDSIQSDPSWSEEP